MAKGSLTPLPYVVLGAVFAPYALWLVRTWHALPLEHTLTCSLALPMAAGLAWVGRDPGAVAHPAPGQWWAALLGGGLALHLVALGTGLFGLSGLGLPLALAGLVWRGRGVACLRRMLLPILFLVFVLPLPWMLQAQFALPSQRASAMMAYLLVRPTTLNVMLDGMYVYTPDFYVLVNDTCSGLSSACALLMLAIVVSQLRRLPPQRSALLLVGVLPVGLLANGARIAFLLVMGHTFGIEWAEGWVHDLSAVAFFGCAYAAMFWASRRLAQRGRRPRATPTTATTAHENTSPAL